MWWNQDLIKLWPWFLTHPVLIHSLRKGEVQSGDKLVDIRAAHGRAVQMISQHGADKRFSCPRGAVEGQHQGPIGAFILKELCHLLWHDVLSQMLSVDILVKVPLQVWSSEKKNRLLWFQTPDRTQTDCRQNILHKVCELCYCLNVVKPSKKWGHFGLDSQISGISDLCAQLLTFTFYKNGMRLITYVNKCLQNTVVFQVYVVLSELSKKLKNWISSKLQSQNYHIISMIAVITSHYVTASLLKFI